MTQRHGNTRFMKEAHEASASRAMDFRRSPFMAMSN
jgi:hypothetical protein